MLFFRSFDCLFWLLFAVLSKVFAIDVSQTIHKDNHSGWVLNESTFGDEWKYSIKTETFSIIFFLLFRCIFSSLFYIQSLYGVSIIELNRSIRMGVCVCVWQCSYNELHVINQIIIHNGHNKCDTAAKQVWSGWGATFDGAYQTHKPCSYDFRCEPYTYILQNIQNTNDDRFHIFHYAWIIWIIISV